MSATDTANASVFIPTTDSWLAKLFVVNSNTSLRIYATLLSFLLVACVRLPRYNNGTSNSKFPVLGDGPGSCLSRCRAYIRWTTDGVCMIKEAYHSDQHAVLRIPTFQRFYIVQPELIHDFKDAPRTTLNATHAIVWYFLGEYTGIDFPFFGRPLWAAVRKLNANLSHFVPGLENLVTLLLETVFPPVEEWTDIVPWPQVLRLIVTSNTKVFVGQELCENVELLNATEDYAQNIAIGAGLLKLVPDVMKPILASIIPQPYRLRRIRKLVREIVGPEIELRRQRRQVRNRDEPPSDMLEMFEEVSPIDQRSPEEITNRVLSLHFAGTHGPSNHVMNVLLDLAATWDEYAEELREELDTALKESSGTLTKAILDKLYKLDSFMKESARLEPGSALSFFRKVLEPVRLPTGEIIPASSLISVPAIATALSEEIYGGDASQFDGRRFYRQRQKEQDLDSTPRDYLWTTPSLGFLNFGYGKYACPGRFYAGAQTKLIVACILLKYDLRLRPGEKRPKSLAFGDANIPDPKTVLLYRSRRSDNAHDHDATLRQ